MAAGATRGVDAFDAGDVAEAVNLALEGTEHSPMPHGEWPNLRGTLGDELLAELLRISPSSLRRYSAGDRIPPDVVVARLHALTLTVVDLAGAYNDFGIRRWFARPRAALGDASPASVLWEDWDPDGPQITAVRSLAADLVGAGATCRGDVVLSR